MRTGMPSTSIRTRTRTWPGRGAVAYDTQKQAVRPLLTPAEGDGHAGGGARLCVDRVGLGRRLERRDEGLHALLYHPPLGCLASTGRPSRRIVHKSIASIWKIKLARLILKVRRADRFLGRCLDHVSHDTMLVGERAAENDEAVGHQSVHERGVRGPFGLLLEQASRIPTPALSD